ncbi:bile acid:sodium symporter, partial [Patescibacteria group bacterium]|nr:bile acid:sodium symporter [Patescibacteria group bacterium]
MNKSLARRGFVYFLMESYLFVLIFGMVFGMLFPDVFADIANYMAIILALVFFLNSIKIDYDELRDYFSDWKMLVMVALLSMVIWPMVVYWLVDAINPAMAVPLLVLTAMPIGMNTPAFANITGGNKKMMIVVMTITSLVAPLTIPLIIQLMAGDIGVDAMALFWGLAKIIYIPFILARIIRHFWNKQIDTHSHSFKSVSMILLVLLIAGLVAKQPEM